MRWSIQWACKPFRSGQKKIYRHDKNIYSKQEHFLTSVSGIWVIIILISLAMQYWAVAGASFAGSMISVNYRLFNGGEFMHADWGDHRKYSTPNYPPPPLPHWLSNQPSPFSLPPFFPSLVQYPMPTRNLGQVFTFKILVVLQEGVGDTQDSFAYDGHRVRKWNLSTAKYGEVNIALLNFTTNFTTNL